MTLLIVLMVVMQFKHFIADYPLQNKYMMGKFKDTGWVKPLAAHCGVHFVFTFLIVLFTMAFVQGERLIWYWWAWFTLPTLLATFDFTIHFIMDRIKASSTLLGRYESLSKQEFKGLSESYAMVKYADSHTCPIIKEQGMIEKNRIEARFKSNVYFWWALGADQLVHHLTDIAVVAILVYVVGG